MVLNPVIVQCGQVFITLALAPLLHGFIATVEERIQRGRGPSIFQPYRDLWKLLHKEQLIPESASWIFWAAPVIAFTVMLIVPFLIPVLTNYPLPLSDMGDILGGGLILTLGNFMILLAGLDSGQPFGGLGASRAAMLAILAEPTLILVFVGITFHDHAMLPFVANHLLAENPVAYWGPVHVFLVAAFFILLTVETDRLPIHSTIPYEIYMIDEARVLEYSGPLLALLRWASWMKQFILYTIFLNVFLFPWGLATSGHPANLLIAVAWILVKYATLGLFMAVIDTAQARLRFYRYQEPLAASFLFAVLAIVAYKV